MEMEIDLNSVYGLELTCCLRGGRKILAFSVRVETNMVWCGGIEVDFILEWGLNRFDISSDVEINYIFL